MKKLKTALFLIGVANLLPLNLRAQTTTEKTMPEQFQLSKVGYVMLGVADIRATADFYGGKLGLKETRASDDLAFFDAGTISLVVSTEIGKTPGDSEIVFTVAHVREAYEALLKAGVKFIREPHQVSGDSWAANFKDPDGHNLTVFGAM